MIVKLSTYRKRIKRNKKEKEVKMGLLLEAQ